MTGLLFGGQANTTSIVSAPGVLANDTDADGDSLSIIELSSPPQFSGLLWVTPNGYFRYVPNTDFFGSETFPYIVSDGNGGTDTAVVSITVAPVNDPPIINPLPDISLDEDTSLNNTIDLWAYAGDVEDPDIALTFSIVGNTNPDCGVSIDINRYIDVNPATNWNGYSDVTIKVGDTGGLTAVDTFRITVNPVVDQASDINGFIDDSVAAGTLTGSGPGNSADGRLNTLKNMITEAGDLIDAGDYSAACQKLNAAYKKCDGNPKPPDFVIGPAATELANLIQDLRASIGCS